jgi:putative transposase
LVNEFVRPNFREEYNHGHEQTSSPRRGKNSSAQGNALGNVTIQIHRKPWKGGTHLTRDTRIGEPVMPQSLSRVLVHLIFSTKNRQPFIESSIRSRLHAYLAGILDNLECPSLQTGGVADHVHILFALGRTITQAGLVEEVKKSSSKWMKAEGGSTAFSWQAGYGAFSVGESQVTAVVRYIANQQEHHRKLTFQEEYRKFLEKYRVPFDERYVWD